MKKYIIILFIIGTYCNIINAQNNKFNIITNNSILNHLQGLWERENSIEAKYIYKIYKGYYCLTFSKYINELDIDVNIVGFIDGINSNIDLSYLKDDGSFNKFVYNASLNEKTGILTGLQTTNFYFEFGDKVNLNRYFTGTNSDIIYSKIKLPKNISLFDSKTWMDLLFHSKKDHRDYIFEFLDIDLREVVQNKAFIYDSVGGEIKSYLIKGNIIEILSIDAEYVKFRHLNDEGNFISGYLKYTTIRYKAPIASFDSIKANTIIEKTICGNVILANLDLRVSRSYKNAKDIKGKVVQTEQRKWIKERNKLKSPNLADKLIKTYKKRLIDLNN